MLTQHARDPPRHRHPSSEGLHPLPVRNSPGQPPRLPRQLQSLRRPQQLRPSQRLRLRPHPWLRLRPHRRLRLPQQLRPHPPLRLRRSLRPSPCHLSLQHPSLRRLQPRRPSRVRLPRRGRVPSQWPRSRPLHRRVRAPPAPTSRCVGSEEKAARHRVPVRRPPARPVVPVGLARATTRSHPPRAWARNSVAPAVLRVRAVLLVATALPVIACRVPAAPVALRACLAPTRR